MNKFVSIDKDLLMENLMTDGIETRPFFIPVSAMPFYNSSDTPNTIFLSKAGKASRIASIA